MHQILDREKPAHHGVIVRTAAKGVTAEEIERDVARLLRQWEQIDQLAKKQKRAGLLYREPDLAARLIREEFNSEYRAVVIDDPALFTEMSEYVAAISPAMGDPSSRCRCSSVSTFTNSSTAHWKRRFGCHQVARW